MNWPWNPTPRRKKKVRQQRSYNQVPWNFCRYWEPDRWRLSIETLELNSIYFFFAGSADWEKNGVVSVKNMLKKGNFGGVIADIKDKHLTCSRFWFVAVETGQQGSRSAHVYIFQYKSQIDNLVLLAGIAEVMES
jgi:hypothetical protein